MNQDTSAYVDPTQLQAMCAALCCRVARASEWAGMLACTVLRPLRC